MVVKNSTKSCLSTAFSRFLFYFGRERYGNTVLKFEEKA
jgi:hypothetical protein